jgi:hypothetical protein
MATTEELQKMLAEAEAQRHRILTGKAVTESQHGEKGAKFRSYAADLQQLDNYIASLKRQLGQDPGVRPPMRPVFGG